MTERERDERASLMVNFPTALCLLPRSTPTKNEAGIHFAFSSISFLLPYLSLAADPASPTRRRLHHAASPWGESGERSSRRKRDGERMGSERKKKPLASRRMTSKKKK